MSSPPRPPQARINDGYLNILLITLVGVLLELGIFLSNAFNRILISFAINYRPRYLFPLLTNNTVVRSRETRRMLNTDIERQNGDGDQDDAVSEGSGSGSTVRAASLTSTSRASTRPAGFSTANSGITQAAQPGLATVLQAAYTARGRSRHAASSRTVSESRTYNFTPSVSTPGNNLQQGFTSSTRQPVPQDVQGPPINGQIYIPDTSNPVPPTRIYIPDTSNPVPPLPRRRPHAMDHVQGTVTSNGLHPRDCNAAYERRTISPAISQDTLDRRSERDGRISTNSHRVDYLRNAIDSLRQPFRQHIVTRVPVPLYAEDTVLVDTREGDSGTTSGTPGTTAGTLYEGGGSIIVSEPTDAGIEIGEHIYPGGERVDEWIDAAQEVDTRNNGGWSDVRSTADLASAYSYVQEEMSGTFGIYPFARAVGGAAGAGPSYRPIRAAGSSHSHAEDEDRDEETSREVEETTEKPDYVGKGKQREEND
ncbi:hypothetical protein SCHPADRAFT_946788 [Schizopora paradoxa]|uniref:Uncharacterized protein n=1 Tax=Schizopora paradoxa TaxID=27342 RepID=A0A0H2RL88_9AGAM|nr:hypothetical protein SCHPADRAFT_946788 [Schizopora paradoxa]